MACPDDKETITGCEAGKIADEEEDNGVTLVEILEEEAQLEEDANAVLGGSDDANCTYRLVFFSKLPVFIVFTNRKCIGVCESPGTLCLCNLQAEFWKSDPTSWCLLSLQLSLP